MPRKLRTAKRRHDEIRVSPLMYRMLLWGVWPKPNEIEQDPADMRELYDDIFLGTGVNSQQRAWSAIEDEALSEWTELFPGTRPPAWWTYSAPSLRQIFGEFRSVVGSGRCQPTGIPFGGPVDWKDLPFVESTPAYLDRLGLWLSGERQRVRSEAFDPELFSWTLTVAPKRIED